jgi:transposase
MSRGYSLDLRERVIALVDEGASRSAAARHFKIAASSAIKWAKRFEETGSFAEKPGKKLVYSPLEAHADWLLAFIASRLDATLAETVAALQDERGFKTTDSSVSRFFKRRGITFKKNPARQRANARRRSHGARSVEGGAAGA